jgi:hypothetical protein
MATMSRGFCYIITLDIPCTCGDDVSLTPVTFFSLVIPANHDTPFPLREHK